MAVALINLSSAACQVGVVPFIKLRVYYYAQVVTTERLGDWMPWAAETGIVERADLLSVDTLPAKIVGRDAQRQALDRCLDPMHKNLPPASAWLYGPPGTGKTAVARHVAAARCNSPNELCLYVNCWERPTLYSVLQALCQECQILDAEAQDTHVKTERLRQRLRDKSVLIVLDEIDRPVSKQRDAIVYELLALDRTGLFCISSNVASFFQLSQRVCSRLTPRLVHFRPYTSPETYDILSHRAQAALLPGTYTDQILQRIVSLDGGDARKALHLLRQAALCAEKQGANRVTQRHVHVDAHAWQAVRLKAQLESLSEHQRIIYHLAKNHMQISSLHLRQLYLLECHRRSIPPAAPRTFSKYIGALIQRGLIDAQYQPGRGPGRMLRAIG